MDKRPKKKRLTTFSGNSIDHDKQQEILANLRLNC